MRSILMSLILAVTAIFFLALGLSAQTDLPDFIDPPYRPRPTQSTIPPFEPPTGAVITVTSQADDLEKNDNCSLREAIQAANTDTRVDQCPAGDGKDLIVLESGVYTMSIEGVGEDENITGDFDILSSMVVRGAGADLTLINANSIDRVLHIHEGAEVDILDVTLSNGEPTYGEPGGGLYNLGAVTLTATIISHNFAGDSISYRTTGYTNTNGGFGGGVANEGSMVLLGSTVVGNQCGRDELEPVPYGVGGAGGGIYNSGDLSVIHSDVVSNTAGTGGSVKTGTVYGSGGDGGGIFNIGHLSVVYSVISADRVGSGGWYLQEPYLDGTGGGIVNTGVATVTNSRLQANIGSGLLNLGTASLIASEIDHNRNLDNSVFQHPQHIRIGSGGGLANYGTLAMTNTTVSHNQSADGDTSYIGLIPGCDGGGIFNAGSLSLENCTISQNMAGEQSDYWGMDWYECVYADCNGGSGGGVANQGHMEVHNSIIAQNHVFDNGTSPDCLGEVDSQGHNLIGEPYGCLLYGVRDQDVYHQYAWLAPLADNGGPTPTHALFPQSPALNTGSCTTVDGTPITEDQRGEPRRAR